VPAIHPQIQALDKKRRGDYSEPVADSDRRSHQPRCLRPNRSRMLVNITHVDRLIAASNICDDGSTRDRLFVGPHTTGGRSRLVDIKSVVGRLTDTCTGDLIRGRLPRHALAGGDRSGEGRSLTPRGTRAERCGCTASSRSPDEPPVARGGLIELIILAPQQATISRGSD